VIQRGEGGVGEISKQIGIDPIGLCCSSSAYTSIRQSPTSQNGGTDLATSIPFASVWRLGVGIIP
jgi:hypothetical protein